MPKRRVAIGSFVAALATWILAPAMASSEWIHLEGDTKDGAPYRLQVEQKSEGVVTVTLVLKRFEKTPVSGQGAEARSRFEDIVVPGWGTLREPGKPALPEVGVGLVLEQRPSRDALSGRSPRGGDPGGPAGSAAAPRVPRKQSGSCHNATPFWSDEASGILSVRTVEEEVLGILPAPFAPRPKRSEPQQARKLESGKGAYAWSEPQWPRKLESGKSAYASSEQQWQWKLEPDKDAYASAVPYPEEVALVAHEGLMRGNRALVLSLRPFRYVAAERKLYVARKIQVDIAGSLATVPESLSLSAQPHGAPVVPSGAVPGGDGASRYASKTFADIAYASFHALPPQKVHALQRGPGQWAPESYLIIANDAFVDSVAPLVEWKTKIGYQVTVVPLSQIGDSYQDVAAFIQDAYDTWDPAPTFVLLVGDGEGAGMVPFVPSPWGCASDFLYSTVDGDDLYSDLLIGRFSAHTAEDVALQVAKTIWYEADVEADAPSDWIPSSICISSSEGDGTSNDDYRSDIICDNQEAHGYAPADRLYHSKGNDTAASISASLNEGRGWVTFLGHGSGTGWSTTVPEYSNSHVQKLTNAFRLPFVVDVSCDNGGFDATFGDCFAEVWMKTGTPQSPRAAVGIYSSSTPAAWDEPAEMAVGIASAVLKDGVMSWGGACAAGRAHMIKTIPGGALEETSHQYVVFGDPSLLLRTEKAAALAVEHPEVLPLGGVDVEVLVKREGAPLVGATVAFFQAGALLALGKTGDGGMAELYVEATETGAGGEDAGAAGEDAGAEGQDAGAAGEDAGVVELTVYAPNSLTYSADIPAMVSGCGLLQAKPKHANCASTLDVALFDKDLDVDPSVPDSAVVTVASSSDPTPLAVQLIETGNGTGKLVGKLVLGPKTTEGVLGVKHGATATLTYEDASCDGKAASTEILVPVDCVGPVVKDVKASAPAANEGSVTFSTDEDADGKIRFGKTAPLAEEASAGWGKQHEASMAGLEPLTKYFIAVEAIDDSGNTTVDDNGGKFYVIATPACAPDCAGKVCGGDGCGGTCGQCCSTQTCEGGACVGGPGCEMESGAGCGGCPCESCVCDWDPYCCDSQWDDLCVGECIEMCGGCPASGDCTGKQCGDDGCGGTCGTCKESWDCTDAGQCVDECVPDCTGKTCGKDGCGGTCGDCTGGKCQDGVCLMPCGGSVTFEGCCDHEMLHYCDNDLEMVVDCSLQGKTCGWKESVSWYDCVDDAVPAPDPEQYPMWCEGACPPQCEGKECGPDGCGSECGQCQEGQVCENGLCELVCKPQCDGRECGDDGCGALCGECAIGFQCVDGACESPCKPQCDDRECGDDGCGSTCGTCAPGMVCSADFLCELAEVEPDVVTVDVVEEVSSGGGDGCSASEGVRASGLAASNGARASGLVVAVLLALLLALRYGHLKVAANRIILVSVRKRAGHLPRTPEVTRNGR